MVKYSTALRGHESMMDIEDERSHMRATFSLRYRIGQPGTAAAE
jgi:hypothetical protein